MQPRNSSTGPNNNGTICCRSTRVSSPTVVKTSGHDVFVWAAAPPANIASSGWNGFTSAWKPAPARAVVPAAASQ
jgi:hypothetical protein